MILDNGILSLSSAGSGFDTSVFPGVAPMLPVRLRRFARRHGLTFLTVLLAAFVAAPPQAEATLPPETRKELT